MTSPRPPSPCPECGWPLLEGYRGTQADDGDVEPTALCTRPSCGWGY